MKEQSLMKLVNPFVSTIQGSKRRYVKKPIVVHALQMEGPFYIMVSWLGDQLDGKAGDWLLQYGEGDDGIVVQSGFKKRYQVIKSQVLRRV